MVSKVYVIGMGMGNPKLLTVAAREALDQSDLIIGAPRLLEGMEGSAATRLPLVRAVQIVETLRNAQASVASVVMSGDVGFYSGAAPLLPLLEGMDVEVIPGISSVVYLCSQLHMSWQDVFCASAHGRECDAAGIVQAHEWSFFLTGGTSTPQGLCRDLVDRGLGEVSVWVGERLSYPDERITKGRACELEDGSFDALAVMLVHRTQREGGPDATGIEAPRLMIAGTASGSGKTTVSCGLMRLLSGRGLRGQACKVGPDYLDPTFHQRVLGVPSRNLDLFLGNADLVRALVAKGAAEADITLIEGVMGYYDGIAASPEASSYDVARVSGTPVVLVVDARGRALSVAAEVAGFVRFRVPSQIAGVILNQVSASYYPMLREAVERETGIPVLGYVPRLPEAALASRHLGLVSADEVDDVLQRVDALAEAMSSTVDVEALLRIARSAPGLVAEAFPSVPPRADGPLIAVARDEAFSFYYADTLDLFEQLGARIAFFSPLRDRCLPPGTSGLYLGGGYPELHARALSQNTPLLEALRRAIAAGMPTIAECGGFLYLHRTLEDDEGVSWPMAGVLEGDARRGKGFGHFGYATLTARHDSLLACEGDELRAHEFHYWRSTMEGDAFHAEKPQSTRAWDCVVATDTLHAGFPHLYLCGNPQAAARFVDACARFAAASEGGEP